MESLLCRLKDNNYVTPFFFIKKNVKNQIEANEKYQRLFKSQNLKIMITLGKPQKKLFFRGPGTKREGGE